MSDSDLIKKHLAVKPIDSYTGSGCNIAPKPGYFLYQIDYWEATEKWHPRAGMFGSCSVYDGLDAAKALMKQMFPKAEIRLGIPCLVFEVRHDEESEDLNLSGRN